MAGQLKVLFVPSCGVSPLNELTPGDTLQRCEAALREWRYHEYSYVLVAGGVFNPPDVQTEPAGRLMAHWFTAHDVPYDRVIVEDASLDTYENIALGLKKLQEHGLEGAEITVLTQWQHAIRFKVTFRRNHNMRIRVIPLHYPVGWKTWCMEWFLILYHLLDRDGTGWLARKNRRDRENAALRRT